MILWNVSKSNIFGGLPFKHEELKALRFRFVTFKQLCLDEENIKYAFFFFF